MTISLCMIVKNEEATLPRCLDAAAGLWDELIIVDTGSTDATVAVAESRGATVLRYEWVQPGNKGASRMVGIEAATADWIVVLDADELICDPGGLRRFLLAPPEPDITAVNVRFVNYDPDTGAETLRWYQVRAFRRGLYRYVHREHEMPHWCGPQDATPREIVLDTIFEHRVPAGREPGKMQPMLDRLTLDVEEHPGDPGPLYFLHRQYLLAGEYQASIDCGLRYLACDAMIDPCECYGNLATCCQQLDAGNEAVRWLQRALAEQPNRRIWWIRLAEMYMSGGYWNIALAYLRGAGELWPGFAWQLEPVEQGAGLQALVDKCQASLSATHHTH